MVKQATVSSSAIYSKSEEDSSNSTVVIQLSKSHQDRLFSRFEPGSFARGDIIRNVMAFRHRDGRNEVLASWKKRQGITPMPSVVLAEQVRQHDPRLYCRLMLGIKIEDQ